MKTQHAALEEVRRAPARSGLARTIAAGALASALALTMIAPAAAGEHKSRGNDRDAKRSESGSRVDRGANRSDSGARVDRREQRVERRDSAPEPRREWRDDGRDDRGSRHQDVRYGRRDDDDDKRGEYERGDRYVKGGREEWRSKGRSYDDRRHARAPREARYVEKWSSNAESRYRGSYRANRSNCFAYRPVHRAPHRVVTWCDRRYYDYASLNVYLPRFWIDFVIVDSAPAGYLFYDPYCDEFFPTVSAFKAHMRYYGYSHSAALDVVWIGDVERDPWYVECSSGPSWSVGIHF